MRLTWRLVKIRWERERERGCFESMKLENHLGEFNLFVTNHRGNELHSENL